MSMSHLYVGDVHVSSCRDRFDVAEGYYMYLTDYNNGQRCPKYERLCKLLKVFKPRPGLRSARDLDEGGRAVYGHHVDKYEGGMRLAVSVYGDGDDGELLDAEEMPDFEGELTAYEMSICNDLKRDRKGDTAVLDLRGVPTEIALAALDYANGNCGPCPYRSGYSSLECVEEAGEAVVVSCTVNWSPAECDWYGGCYLCGGNHLAFWRGAVEEHLGC